MKVVYLIKQTYDGATQIIFASMHKNRRDKAFKKLAKRDKDFAEQGLIYDLHITDDEVTLTDEGTWTDIDCRRWKETLPLDEYPYWAKKNRS